MLFSLLLSSVLFVLHTRGCQITLELLQPPNDFSPMQQLTLEGAWTLSQDCPAKPIFPQWKCESSGKTCNILGTDFPLPASRFTLAIGSLNANTDYKFTFTATMQDNTAVASDYVTVFPRYRDLYARLRNGDMNYQHVRSNFVLDGSWSFDVDFHISLEYSYTWSACEYIVENNVCKAGGKTAADFAVFKQMLTYPGSMFNVELSAGGAQTWVDLTSQTWQITLKYREKTSGRESVATTLVTFKDDPWIPLVTVNVSPTPTVLLNPSDAIVLTTALAYADGSGLTLKYKYEWKSSSASVRDKLLDKSVVDGQDLLIPPGTLVDITETVTFTLNVRDSNSVLLQTATVKILTNQPPTLRLGAAVFGTVNMNGNTAGTSTCAITISDNDFVDNNLPLQYTLHMIHVDANVAEDHSILIQSDTATSDTAIWTLMTALPSSIVFTVPPVNPSYNSDVRRVQFILTVKDSLSAQRKFSSLVYTVQQLTTIWIPAKVLLEVNSHLDNVPTVSELSLMCELLGYLDANNLPEVAPTDPVGKARTDLIPIFTAVVDKISYYARTPISTEAKELLPLLLYKLTLQTVALTPINGLNVVSMLTRAATAYTQYRLYADTANYMLGAIDNLRDLMQRGDSKSVSSQVLVALQEIKNKALVPMGQRLELMPPKCQKPTLATCRLVVTFVTMPILQFAQYTTLEPVATTKDGLPYYNTVVFSAPFGTALKDKGVKYVKIAFTAFGFNPIGSYTAARTDVTQPQAPFLDISVYDHVAGAVLDVEHLTDEQRVTFPIQRNGLQSPVCSAWNPTENVWDTYGVEVLGSIGTVQCATTHLTLFGVVHSSLATVVIPPSTAPTTTAEDDDVDNTDNVKGAAANGDEDDDTTVKIVVPAVVCSFVVLVCLLLLCFCCWYMRRRRYTRERTPTPSRVVVASGDSAINVPADVLKDAGTGTEQPDETGPAGWIAEKDDTHAESRWMTVAYGGTPGETVPMDGVMNSDIAYQWYRTAQEEQYHQQQQQQYYIENSHWTAPQPASMSRALVWPSQPVIADDLVLTRPRDDFIVTVPTTNPLVAPQSYSQQRYSPVRSLPAPDSEFVATVPSNY